MQLEAATSVWTAYQRAEINRSTHPNDKMPVVGGAWYFPVGLSAASIIIESLLASPTTEVQNVLDFGCGYGRVARHLRPMFPNAALHVSDIEREAVEFCAREFDGVDVLSSKNFDSLALPQNIDLAWVGSVFTHLDYGRMGRLFDKLFECLSINGTLVITTHGTRCIEMAKTHPYIAKDKWDRIMRDYLATGVGFELYAEPAAADGQWGVSLMTPGKVWELAVSHPDARLIHFKEAGWADHQDVAVFTKLAAAPKANESSPAAV
jgi:SAM-dependent methyltransferase